MLLQKNIVKKYLALLPDEQTQEAWKWVREPSLDPFLGYYTGKHHLDDNLVFLWLLAGMPVLIVSVIWGINELMAWMNGK